MLSPQDNPPLPRIGIGEVSSGKWVRNQWGKSNHSPYPPTGCGPAVALRNQFQKITCLAKPQRWPQMRSMADAYARCPRTAMRSQQAALRLGKVCGISAGLGDNPRFLNIL
jgi:hypothetical protein